MQDNVLNLLSSSKRLLIVNIIDLFLVPSDCLLRWTCDQHLITWQVKLTIAKNSFFLIRDAAVLPVIFTAFEGCNLASELPYNPLS
ncbi:hypothetical protein SY86_02965 [Erwinia tracheiphila]|uniref:Uncharacterized protein n=1 Tax=Erwinia tracheiphila TaxID=65700 RepID=A0A0M2KBM1_9GAMM|nr:hypothetical protein AV903_07390 [Erwinia tracheiphila]EOS96941.1 hypothetical protein ETR_00105 [Erwinia tracheiphila PSU-1]KKF34638.1 hypothetical protein SY86_02965 [Erwinia tracheiphila]